MDFGKCPICHEYGFMPHTCKPTFFVFRDSDDLWESIGDSSIKRVFASDKEQAAIEYCESDYEIPSDLDVTVISTKDWNDIIDESDEEDLDNDRDTVYEKLLTKCVKFAMESEMIRSFHAAEY